MIFRLFFILYNRSHLNFDVPFWKIAGSVLQGLRFDLVPFSYGIAVSLVLLILFEFTGNKIFRRLAFWIGYVWGLILSVMYLSDAVFFNQFTVHLNAQVLFWLKDFKMVFHMILTSPQMSFIFIPFLLIGWLWYFVLKKIFRHTTPFQIQRIVWLAVFYLMLFGIDFFVAKGRIISHALSPRYAFTDDYFAWNYFKINPFFTVKESLNEFRSAKGLSLMDNEKALKTVRQLFRIDTAKYTSPLARDILNEGEPHAYNVVLIFMERKATWKMRYFGNKDNMTPFLDNLFLNSLAFDRFFSSGTRTYEGFFGTLYGHPVLFDEHPFYGKNINDRLETNTENIKYFYGMPHVLKEKGYYTVFFCPHVFTFDNTGIFILRNGFDKIYTQGSYPKDSLKNSWGVDDHFLFEFALGKMDSLYEKGQKFFSVIQTISDHDPYYVPDFIRGKNIKIRAARFSDWSLKKFFEKARQKPWFDRTVFILVGDHGKPKNVVYPADLPTHHVPLIFYAKNIRPQIKHTVGGQPDIMPTLMHLLGFSYTDNTFGKNLLDRKKRICIL